MNKKQREKRLKKELGLSDRFLEAAKNSMFDDLIEHSNYGAMKNNGSSVDLEEFLFRDGKMKRGVSEDAEKVFEDLFDAIHIVSNKAK